MKPGWKSSEFWLTLANVAIPVVNQSAGWNLDTTSILGVSGAVVAYIASRGYAKGKAASTQEPKK